MENIRYPTIRHPLPLKPNTHMISRKPLINGLKRSYSSYYQSDQQRIPLRPVQSTYPDKVRHPHSSQYPTKPTLHVTVADVDENELDAVYRNMQKWGEVMRRGKERRLPQIITPIRSSIASLPTPELTPDRSSTGSLSAVPDPHFMTPVSAIPDAPSATDIRLPSPIIHPLTPPTPISPFVRPPHKPRSPERRLLKLPPPNDLGSSPPPVQRPPKPKSDVVKHRSPPKCALRYISGKGFGLVTTSRIKKGETIIIEKPFFYLPTAVQDTEEDGALLPYWNRLDDKDRIKVLSFMSKRDDHDVDSLARGGSGLPLSDLIHDIVHNNGIPLEVDPNLAPKRTGMFEMIGRVNHSCLPNSVWRWKRADKRLYLVAYIDIPKGAEITASYLDNLCQPAHKRQADLRESFAFTCSCSACPQTPANIEASDKKLKRYRSLEREWTLPGDSWEYEDWTSNYPRAMRVLNEAKGILESEGKYQAMGDLLEEIWILNISHGKKKEAVVAGKEMQEYYAICRGREEAGGEWDETVVNPEMCANWREAVRGGAASRGRSSQPGVPSKRRQRRETRR